MPRTTKNINWPLIIIVATVFVSATRWIPALMRSEGFEIPAMWLSWWVPVSAILAVGQPIVEAVSIAFALNAYRYMKNDSQKNLMLVLIGGTLVSFVGVLTPNIVASGSSRSVYELLGDWMWFWGISVVLSTVMPVAAVAFGAARMSETAQKTVSVATPPQKKEGARPDENPWESDGTSPQLPTELVPTLTEPQTLQLEAPKQAEPTKADTRIVVNGYADFKAKMNALDGNRPQTGAQVDRMFKVARKTAYVYWGRYSAEKESQK